MSDTYRLLLESGGIDVCRWENEGGARDTHFIGGALEARSGSERAPRDRISEWLNEGTVPPAMTMTTPDRERVVERADAQPADTRVLFRLRAIMRQGTAASLPAVWERYATIDSARAAVRGMYSNDRVLRVLIVTDDVPPRFVEWVER